MYLSSTMQASRSVTGHIVAATAQKWDSVGLPYVGRAEIAQVAIGGTNSVQGGFSLTCTLQSACTPADTSTAPALYRDQAGAVMMMTRSLAMISNADAGTRPDNAVGMFSSPLTLLSSGAMLHGEIPSNIDPGTNPRMEVSAVTRLGTIAWSDQLAAK